MGCPAKMLVLQGLHHGSTALSDAHEAKPHWHGDGGEGFAGLSAPAVGQWEGIWGRPRRVNADTQPWEEKVCAAGRITASCWAFGHWNCTWDGWKSLKIRSWDTVSHTNTTVKPGCLGRSDVLLVSTHKKLGMFVPEHLSACQAVVT